MEQIKELAKTEQQTKTALTCSQNILQRIIKTGETYVLSDYGPGQATPTTVAMMLKKLKGCFPDTTNEVFDNLIEMLKEENWSDTRIRDAVKNCILNHRYPRIAPADILSFDKRRKLYRQSELEVKFYKEHGYTHSEWKKYEKITIPAKDGSVLVMYALRGLEQFADGGKVLSI